MTAFTRVRSMKAKQGRTDRMTITIGDRTFTVNTTALNRIKSSEEARAALEQFLGRPVPDIHFHKNRDGTWAIATGIAPSVYPEDEVQVE